MLVVLFIISGMCSVSVNYVDHVLTLVLMCCCVNHACRDVSVHLPPTLPPFPFSLSSLLWLAVLLMHSSDWLTLVILSLGSVCQFGHVSVSVDVLVAVVCAAFWW